MPYLFLQLCGGGYRHVCQLSYNYVCHVQRVQLYICFFVYLHAVAAVQWDILFVLSLDTN